MTRRAVDYCMFCDTIPCSCNKKPAKTTPKLKKKSAPTIPVPTESPVTTKPTVSTKSTKPTTSSVPTKPPVDFTKIKQIRTEEDLALRNALTVLANADLLHRDELVKHRDMIDLPTNRIDILIWRQDHAAATKTNTNLD